MTLNFKQAFVHAVNTPSDINEHLPLMNILAKLCTHVTEFGVRWGASATAWLNNDVVVRGYDIVAYEPAIELFSQAQAAGKDAQLFISNLMLRTPANLQALSQFARPGATEFQQAGLGGVPMPAMTAMNAVWASVGTAWVKATSGSSKAAPAFKSAAVVVQKAVK